MLVSMVILFLVGMIFIVGPTVLKWFLEATASVVPLSWPTMWTAVVIVSALVITAFVYMSFADGRICHRYYKKTMFKKVRGIVRRVLTIECIISLLAVMLLLFNGSLISARDSWIATMAVHEKGFFIAKLVGILMVCSAVCFFVGVVYQRKRKTAEYSERHRKVREKMRDETRDQFEDVGEIPPIQTFSFTENPKTSRQSSEISDDDLRVELPQGASQKLS